MHSSFASLAGMVAVLNMQLVADRERRSREAHTTPSEVAVPPDMLFGPGSGLDPHISPKKRPACKLDGWRHS
jgi:K+-transporting ATPase c subunit